MRELIDLVEDQLDVPAFDDRQLDDDKLDELSIPKHLILAEQRLRQAGWKMLGKGYYSTVWWKPKTDYVLKLFNSKDVGYKAFIRLILDHPNKHFPRLKGRLVHVTDSYSAIRMEKLLPAKTDLPIGVYVFCKGKEPSPDMDFTYKQFKRIEEYLGSDPELKKALDLIVTNLLPFYSEDLHRENVMQRQDGTFVIIDPVSSGFID